jgi:epsin
MNLSLDSLKDQVSNLSLYDLKAGVRKVQNAVMNYTEMEAKVSVSFRSSIYKTNEFVQVREATNNEPWGASSSLMQEIANATYN